MLISLNFWVERYRWR